MHKYSRNPHLQAIHAEVAHIRASNERQLSEPQRELHTREQHERELSEHQRELSEPSAREGEGAHERTHTRTHTRARGLVDAATATAATALREQEVSESADAC
jgi:hypothetical protein